MSRIDLEKSRERCRRWREANKEHCRAYNLQDERYRNEWCRSTLRRHRMKGYEVLPGFLLTLRSYAWTAPICPYCGRPIDWSPGKGKLRDFSPTLDRVNGGKKIDHIWEGADDESEGAVVIVHNICNLLKSSLTFKEASDYHWQWVKRFRFGPSYQTDLSLFEPWTAS